MLIQNEIRAERKQRRHRALVLGLRDQVLPRLPVERRRESEEGFAQLDTMLSRSTQEHLEALNAPHLSEEGKRQRLSEITQRESKVLDRFVGDTQKLRDKLAETRRDALHGHVQHEGGYVARKPTPKEDVHRVQDLLMGLTDERRRDIFLNACRRADAESWAVQDAVESAPGWLRLVDEPTIEVGRAARLQQSPSAPAIEALEAEIQMRDVIADALLADTEV